MGNHFYWPFPAFSKHIKLYCQREDGNVSALIGISISSSKKCKSMLLFAAPECIPYLQLILKDKYSFYPAVPFSLLFSSVMVSISFLILIKSPGRICSFLKHQHEAFVSSVCPDVCVSMSILSRKQVRMVKCYHGN